MIEKLAIYSEKKSNRMSRRICNFGAIMNSYDMEMTKDVLVEEKLDGLGTEALGNHLCHALCLGGECRFRYNEGEMTLRQDDLMIVRKGHLVSDLRPSEDFQVKVLYVTAPFIELSTPQTNYGMKGSVSLFLNPVMHLSRKQTGLVLRHFDWIEYRLGHTGHGFYRELLANAVQGAILDFFDIHAGIYGEGNVSTANANLLERFFVMLENGEYRINREVAYYADKLCVTPKYLSEVCKKVSGSTANYWINRYTVLDICRCLRDRSLTFVQISDMFRFSSPAYFSRYVQHNLGMNPTEYRD